MWLGEFKGDNEPSLAGLPCDLPICVLNEKPPAFLRKKRPMSQELSFKCDEAQQRSSTSRDHDGCRISRVPMSQELGLMFFAELESVRWSEHATRWLSVFVIVERHLKIF
jgi:hypothetical protein